MGSFLWLVLIILMAMPERTEAQTREPPQRPRARDIGLITGILPSGSRNAITDVDGVRVGHVTLSSGDAVHTGVTAIIPHGGDVFRERVPAAIHVGNGFGKLAGFTQVRELGELETPILLTCTLCVWRAADALAQWMLAKPGMQNVLSINPVVGETNDGQLNDIRARAVTSEDVARALGSANSGDVDEGSVGAGAGTIAFGWKGGIGTSSRKLPQSLGGYTVGVLVQSNFGGVLTMNGAPVGRELGRYSYQNELGDTVVTPRDRADGSIMIVVATDAPLESRNLERLAARAIVGVGRTGGNLSNGSGDYVIAFSTAQSARRNSANRLHQVETLSNDAMSALFLAVAEATEESIYNSLLRATTVKGHKRTAEAIPIEPLMKVLQRYNVLNWDRNIPPGKKR